VWRRRAEQRPVAIQAMIALGRFPTLATWPWVNQLIGFCGVAT
jgi:hypothetical protein